MLQNAYSVSRYLFDAFDNCWTTSVLNLDLAMPPKKETTRP